MAARDLEFILHSAYSAVRASESNKALTPITLDHLLQEHIDSIKGGSLRLLLSSAGTPLNQARVSKLDALDVIKKAVDDVVAAVEAAGDDPQKLAKLGFDEVVIV